MCFQSTSLISQFGTSASSGGDFLFAIVQVARRQAVAFLGQFPLAAKLHLRVDELVFVFFWSPATNRHFTFDLGKLGRAGCQRLESSPAARLAIVGIVARANAVRFRLVRFSLSLSAEPASNFGGNGCRAI